MLGYIALETALCFFLVCQRLRQVFVSGALKNDYGVSFRAVLQEGGLQHSSV